MTKKTFQQFVKWLKNNWLTLLLGGFSLFIIILAVLFIIDSGGLFFWTVEPTYWAQFGSFLGAFLLAMTLIYQIRAFRRQQIETKFFELVRYYRENVGEMRIKNPFYYKSDLYKNEDKNERNEKNLKGNEENKTSEREFDEKIVTGRRAFKIIFDQYRVAYGLCKQTKLLDQVKFDKCIIEKEYFSYFNYFRSPTENENKTTLIKRFIENEIAFLITFWGVPEDISKEVEERVDRQFNLPDILYIQGDKKISISFLQFVKNLVTVYEHHSPTKYSGIIRKLRIQQNIFSTENIISKKKLRAINFFGGHQYHLGHYFRHLYQTVSYIDKQPWYVLNEKEKYQFVKTLRAQMSNYEQALLFINSLTVLGRNWEYDLKEKKRLISTYHLIKNLPKYFVPEMNPQDYYPKVDFEWEKSIS